jgi:hypothetical protein
MLMPERKSTMKKVIILVLLAGCASQEPKPKPYAGTGPIMYSTDTGAAQEDQRILEYNRTHKPIGATPSYPMPYEPVNFPQDTSSIDEIIHRQHMENAAYRQEEALRRIENEIKEQEYRRPRGRW